MVVTHFVTNTIYVFGNGKGTGGLKGEFYCRVLYECSVNQYCNNRS